MPRHANESIVDLATPTAVENVALPSPIPIEGFLGDDQDAVDTMPLSLLRGMPYGFTGHDYARRHAM